MRLIYPNLYCFNLILMIVSVNERPGAPLARAFVLSRVTQFLDDSETEEIKPNDLTRYCAYLRTDYTPRRSNGDNAPLKGSTLQNHWKGIRIFFG